MLLQVGRHVSPGAAVLHKTKRVSYRILSGYASRTDYSSGLIDLAGVGKDISVRYVSPVRYRVGSSWGSFVKTIAVS